MTTVRFLLLILLPLAACGEFPTAGDPAPGRTAYPEIAPLSGLIAGLPPLPDAASDEPAEDDPDTLIRDRADALNSRAEALRRDPS